eukprot:TRINITY_DN11231_c0_g1_i1.p1 TRINITY_DN11231_c0_g1~~TRINITY_DN11231_c0_g1_i1.p1  ORF type:complete len:708 (+),score=98.99 TRINITY_DN11231_c0_g1_i1:76-2124(+)
MSGGRRRARAGGFFLFLCCMPVCCSSLARDCPAHGLDLVLLIDASVAMQESIEKAATKPVSRWDYLLQALSDFSADVLFSGTEWWQPAPEFGLRVSVTGLAENALITAPDGNGQLTGNKTSVLEQVDFLRYSVVPSSKEIRIASALKSTVAQLLVDAGRRRRAIAIATASEPVDMDSVGDELAMLSDAQAPVFLIGLSQSAASVTRLASSPLSYHCVIADTSVKFCSTMHAEDVVTKGLFSVCSPSAPWGAFLVDDVCQLRRTAGACSREDCMWTKTGCWPVSDDAAYCGKWTSKEKCEKWGSEWPPGCVWDDGVRQRCEDVHSASPPVPSAAPTVVGVAKPMLCLAKVSSGMTLPNGAPIPAPFSVSVRVKIPPRLDSDPVCGAPDSPAFVLIGWYGDSAKRELGVTCTGQLVYVEAALGQSEYVAAGVDLMDGESYDVLVSRCDASVVLYVNGVAAALRSMPVGDDSALLSGYATTCRAPGCTAAPPDATFGEVKLFDQCLSLRDAEEHAVRCGCSGERNCGSVEAAGKMALRPAAADSKPGAPSNSTSSTLFGLPQWVGYAFCAAVPLALLVLLQVARKGVSWARGVDFDASPGESRGMEGARKRHLGFEEKRTNTRAQRKAGLMAEIEIELARARCSGDMSTPSTPVQYRVASADDMDLGSPARPRNTSWHRPVAMEL